MKTENGETGKMQVVLASASPRRRELLEQIGIGFEVKVCETNEDVLPGKSADMIVEELSARKAQAVWDELGNKAVVIGADTVVELDGIVMGKPSDEADAMKMLSRLQNREHHVYTGVTVIDPKGCKTTFHEKTTVFFAPMSKKEIQEYVATKDPLDKAGAYGIQGFCARYIRGIEGDYNTVVGLPVGRLYRELDRLSRKSADKKAVVFDLDGTLSDTIESIAYCGNTALNQFGLKSFEARDYQYFAGDGAANLVKRALIAAGDKELTLYDSVFAKYKELFAKHCMDGVKPYRGIPELIEELKRKGLRICVLSNKPHNETVHVVEELFGKGTFDIIQGQEEGLALKPDPSGVFRILEKMNRNSKERLESENLLYLGDTGTDMQTGRSAGAYTLGVLWGFREAEEMKRFGADELIKEPLEALEYVGGIVK